MKVYYCNYETSENIAFDKAVEMSYDEAIKAFNDIAKYEENFYGVELSPAVAVQFVFLGNDEWLIDIPDNQKGGCYTKEINQAECLWFIKEVYANGKVPELEGFSFDSFPNQS